MDVLTSETCWALNNEIIKQVTSSWSLFIQPDRQYTHNVTMRRVRATIVVAEKQWVLHNLSVCIRYTLCNAHAPYWHLWPAPLYDIFSTFSHKRHDFRVCVGGGEVTGYKMCVSNSPVAIIRNVSNSKKNWGRYYRVSHSLPNTAFL